MKSILKDIILHNNCEMDKFMYKVECINSLTDISHECFVTTLVTGKEKKVLFITLEIQQNWYETVKEIELIVQCLTKKFNLTSKEYTMILHTFLHQLILKIFTK